MRSPRYSQVLALVLWALAAADGSDEKKTYEGHRVYDVAVTDRSQVSRVHRLAAAGGYELWDDTGSSGWLQLQVAPEGVQQLEAALNASSLPYRLRIADVQSLIDDQHSEEELGDEDASGAKSRHLLRAGLPEDSDSRGARRMNLFPGVSSKHVVNRIGEFDDDMSNSIYEEDDDDTQLDGFNFGAYYRFLDIEAFLRQLAETYTQHATLHVIGKTHENRPLYLLRLREDVNVTAVKPVMWIDCGVHAREWISPAICLYSIGRLLGGDRRWLARYDWHLVPVMNPDGYEYSHTHDRLWRKNRRRLNYCTGVDLNRNFAARWGTFGVTFLECGLTFPGYRPFSERESRAVRDAVLRDRHRLAAFNSVHSYGQLWLLPYGYSWFASKHIRQQRHVGRAATRAMRAVNGVPYRYGISSRVLYLDSGTSTDWAYHAGVKHSVAIEARDRGFYGFLLPRRLILPTAREIWAGLAEQARMLAR